MFTRLRVQDYQSIKEADLVLSPFTVIVGKSRSGKSAALRALRGAIFNETGDDLIRWGQKQAVVTVETSEGDVITWTKTRTSAEYDLNGNRYTKLAGGVPDDITGALGVRSIDVDSTLTLSPQLHEQGEYAFLIDKSPGQAAKALAKMTRLDIVVKAQQHCKSAIRAIKEKLKSIELGMSRLEPELDEWDTDANQREIDWVDRSLERIDPLHDALFAHDRGHRALETLMALDALDSRSFTVDVNGLITRVDRIEGLQPLVEALQRDIAKSVRLDDILSRTDTIVKGWDAMTEEDLSLYDIERADTNLHAANSSIDDIDKALAEVKMCPVCGGPL